MITIPLTASPGHIVQPSPTREKRKAFRCSTAEGLHQAPAFEARWLRHADRVELARRARAEGVRGVVGKLPLPSNGWPVASTVQVLSGAAASAEVNTLYVPFALAAPALPPKIKSVPDTVGLLMDMVLLAAPTTRLTTPGVLTSSRLTEPAAEPFTTVGVGLNEPVLVPGV